MKSIRIEVFTTSGGFSNITAHVMESALKEYSIEELRRMLRNHQFHILDRLLHNEYGPALVFCGGGEYYYLNGEQWPKEFWESETESVRNNKKFSNKLDSILKE